MTRLTDITDIIRSKNSGPFELTFDLIFTNFEWFEKVAASDVFNAEFISELLNIPQADILAIVNFKPAKAIKITIKRPFPSGSLGETDVYGAQQHAPFLAVTLNL